MILTIDIPLDRLNLHSLVNTTTTFIFIFLFVLLGQTSLIAHLTWRAHVMARSLFLLCQAYILYIHVPFAFCLHHHHVILTIIPLVIRE